MIHKIKALSKSRAFLTLIVVGILVSLSAVSAFALNDVSGDTFGSAFTQQSGNTVCGIACALKGTVGWIIIGFGMIMALWDYFIQKQGNLLIIAIIGVVAVVIVSRAMYAGAGCASAGYDCSTKAVVTSN